MCVDGTVGMPDESDRKQTERCCGSCSEYLENLESAGNRKEQDRPEEYKICRYLTSVRDPLSFQPHIKSSSDQAAIDNSSRRLNCSTDLDDSNSVEITLRGDTQITSPACADQMKGCSSISFRKPGRIRSDHSQARADDLSLAVEWASIAWRFYCPCRQETTSSV
jgi:hypothetical protein